MCDRPATIEKTGGLHGGRDVFTAFLPERGGSGPIVLAFGHRQAVFKLNDSRYFFAARVIVRERDHGAVVADERPDDVSVSAAGFGMEDTRAWRFLKSEFALVMLEERGDHGVRVGAVRGRINVDVMNGPVSAAMSRGCDELTDLIAQMLGSEATGGHHFDFLAVLLFEQMAGEGRSA
ncbi:hypothetical protein BJ123_13020 [Rhodopseudomonas thermotolerans]|uniref:Uncharacterized protein n=2 Tax=Rhodopseudomonas TaxID=1073 RepID=A0A336JTI3_9BRAD|nr:MULTISPECIES: hypothetical protein [Rhodopseudomonas]RED25787.1 hypothetical protein BJ125_13020 [Rhodopseudomonas pentothenatexigens]REF90416.1 hypothetical protein BJ123_13020 [Rhodopseudomonas thermotolerans]SSW93115.1 hypothetical protein SAMN05892882_13020 [Rhodopseudomonas pentothenatexigens]